MTRASLAPFAVTQHAVERYVERWAQGRPERLARHELEEAALRARPAGLTRDGQDVWTADGEVMLVVRWERDLAVVTTVLPAHASYAQATAQRAMTAEEADLLRNARLTIERAAAGGRVSPAALERAEDVVACLGTLTR